MCHHVAGETTTHEPEAEHETADEHDVDDRPELAEPPADD